MAGKLVHFEIAGAGRRPREEFWSGVFGWKFGDSAMPEFEYHMVRTGDDQGGAIMPDGERRRPPRSSTSTPTTSMRRSPRSASSAGRRTTRQPIPHVGWFARCTDTEGIAFSLFQSDESVRRRRVSPH